MEVVCESDKVKALSTQANIMENELQKWKNEVQQIRANYYELNYFTTLQLITLRKDLGVLKSTRAKNSMVSPSVLALLQSVSPNVTRDTILRTVRNVALLPQEQLQVSASEPSSVQLQGNLRTHSHNLDEQQDPRESSSRKSKAIEVTHKQCTLNCDKLTEGQREILIYIVDRFGFPQQLVLKAFEECRGEINKYDIQNWCLENAERYQFEDEVSDDEATDTSIVEEPMALRPSGAATNMLSWVGQSLMQYIAPQKQDKKTSTTEQISSPMLNG